MDILAAVNLANIDIVMVGTTHPGNIGAAARAMHNMSVSSLVLVEPKCPIGEIAYARASGASAILDNRRTTASLQEAVRECSLVIASSARIRSLPWPEVTPQQTAEKIRELDAQTRVALVFGREHSGLTNAELQLCHYMVNIPANPEFSSLNVAAAIQVLCYEIFKMNTNPVEERQAIARECAATSHEIEGYFRHLEQVLTTTQFLDTKNPGLLMQRLRRLYQRLEMTRSEVNILRGILSSVEKYRSRSE
ncbi:MAG: RNA methyltransferase [Gammaproteobacteria bacterium]|nr:RNA methyltransferase [Gammaproteobacteria bacterium]